MPIVIKLIKIFLELLMSLCQEIKKLLLVKKLHRTAIKEIFLNNSELFNSASLLDIKFSSMAFYIHFSRLSTFKLNCSSKLLLTK